MFREMERRLIGLANTFAPRIAREFDRLRPVIEEIEWIEVNTDELGNERSAIAAVDSSFTIVESRIGLMFFVQGLAQAWSRRLGSSSLRFADCGFIEVEGLSTKLGRRRVAPKHILSSYAQLLELENVYNLASRMEENPTVLIDGSVIAFTINRAVKGDGVVTSIDRGSIRLSDICRRRLRLVVLLARSFLTLFIAKSSWASVLTSSSIPDLYLLEIARVVRYRPISMPGFTKPRYIEIDELVRATRWNREELESAGLKCITCLYVRLREGAQAFQVTAVGRLSERDARRIFEILYPWSKDIGYPIPLESVHRLSKLERRDLVESLHRLGIPIVSGREVLE